MIDKTLQERFRRHVTASFASSLDEFDSRYREFQVTVAHDHLPFCIESHPLQLGQAQGVIKARHLIAATSDDYRAELRILDETHALALIEWPWFTCTAETVVK